MKNLFLLVMLSLLHHWAYAEPFEEGNSPYFFRKLAGTEMIYNLELLPLKGEILDSRYGWSETYWPSQLGGIAYRWNHPNPEPFRYRLKSQQELMKMSFEEISQLSPAELYDVAQGDYQFSLTRKTLSMVSSRDLWWEGICHGWSMAATNYPEPAKVIVTNPDGIKVPFGSSDVKALLAMHDAYNYGGAFSFTGRRCRVNGKVPGEAGTRDRHVDPPSDEEANIPECKDVNAGAFHVVLTNMIGIHGMGFVADIDRFNDVWNQPVTSYSTEFLAEEAISIEESLLGIVRKIRVKTKMIYGEELKFFTPELAATGILNFVSKNPVTGTPHQEFRSKEYEYFLEVDGNGKISGGSWISDTRPDFLWLYQRSRSFRNAPIPLGGLAKIYRPI
jgi:hypothetical protein